MDTINIKREIDDIEEDIEKTANIFIPAEVTVEEHEFSDFEDEASEENDDLDYDEATEKTFTKRRKTWIKPSLCNRAFEGEYGKLFQQLKNNDEEFTKHFQISYKKFSELLEMISPYIRKKNTSFREAISTEERLAVSLRYLVTGKSLVKIGDDYKLGTTTVRQLIFSVVEAIANLLPSKVMQLPTEESWQNIEQNFYEEYSFPNCVGIIDGREFVLNISTGTKESILLLAVIDANSKFIIVNVSDYHKLSEGGVLNTTMLGKLLNSGELLNLPPDKPIEDDKPDVPHFFIASNVFPLRSNVLRPYGKNQRSTEETKLFNNYIQEALKPADKAFKMLINYYKIYQNKFVIKPQYAKNIILASCCLHNFLLEDREGNCGTVKEITKYIKKLPPQRGNAGRNATVIRDCLKDYFASKSKDIDKT